MNHTRTTITSLLPRRSLLLAGGLLLAAACASTSGSPDGEKPMVQTKSGSVLWAQNCRRCHNFRTPSDLSDSQWGAAMMHMRVRADLTAEEYTLIAQFLKASN